MGVNELRGNNEESERTLDMSQGNVLFDEEKYNQGLSDIRKEGERQRREQELEVAKLKQSSELPYRTIKFDDLIQNLLSGQGFSDIVKDKLNSSKELLNGYSLDEIYGDFSSMLERVPLLKKMCEVDDIRQREILLNEALKKQRNLVEEHYNEEQLSILSDKILESILSYNNELNNRSSLSGHERLDLCSTIIRKLSDDFGIKCPDIVGFQIYGVGGLGSKEIIKLDVTCKYPSHMVQLMAHEFTHCLQDHRKTPGSIAIQESNENYVMPMGDGLDNLAMDVYNESLMEKEAVFVGGRVKEKFLNTMINMEKSEIIQNVASVFHEEWRKNRLQKDGKYKPMIEKAEDGQWIKEHGTDVVDIANTKFDELPSNWKYENFEAAKVAVDLVLEKIIYGEEISPEMIEEMSKIVHIEWLKRNGKEGSFENQRVSYEDLSEEEKAKDRLQILITIEQVKNLVKK